MNYNKLDNLSNIHYWGKYEPEETRYSRYAKDEPYIIATGHKIVDVYNTFCRARGMLYYACLDNYGDLSSDNDISHLFTKSQMLIAGILEYSICLDLSWQVIWAYFQPSSLKYLLTGKYEEMEKECTSESVHQQLSISMALEGTQGKLSKDIKELLTNFENNGTIKKMRGLYNMIKHRGTIHLIGLGDNDDSLFYSVNDKNIPKLNRISYDTEDIANMLYEYDECFTSYFSKLIDLLIQKEYLQTKCSFEEFVESALVMSVISDN